MQPKQWNKEKKNCRNSFTEHLFLGCFFVTHIDFRGGSGSGVRSLIGGRQGEELLAKKKHHCNKLGKVNVERIMYLSAAEEAATHLFAWIHKTKNR